MQPCVHKKELLKKMTLELNPREGEGFNHVYPWGKDSEQKQERVQELQGRNVPER